jgi:hypothetical protein
MTKSLLLTQIANKPNINTDDLWKFMNARRKRRGMVRKNRLYQHLKELESEKLGKLIIRIQQGHNDPDEFRINDGFEQFVGIFNIRDDNKYRQELKQTHHYQGYTQIDNFLEKCAVYRLKKNLLQLDAYLKAPLEGSDEPPSDRDYREKLIKIFKVNPGDENKFAHEFRSLTEEINRLTIDALVPVLEKQMTARMPKGWNINPKGHITFLMLQATSQEEEGPIQNMLRDSPQVMEFLINSNYYDPIFLQNMLVRLTSLQSINEDALKYTMQYGADDPETAHFDILDRVEKYKRPDETRETALFQTLKGLAICTEIKGISRKSKTRKK